MTFAHDTRDALVSTAALVNTGVEPATLQTLEDLEEFVGQFGYTPGEAVGRPVFGSSNGVVASDRSPSRTDMSTTSGTPVNSSSLMNAVFGDVASASVMDSVGG